MIDTIMNLNREIFLGINGFHNTLFDVLMYYISQKWIWLPFYICLSYFYFLKIGWRGFLLSMGFIALMILCADGISTIFKHVIPKLRPTHDPDIQHLVHTVNGYVGGLYGTVSAHAANSFALAVFTSRLFKKRWITISMVLWAVIVSYSRMYLGVHFPLDIIFGIVTGLATGTAMYELFMFTMTYLGKTRPSFQLNLQTKKQYNP